MAEEIKNKFTTSTGDIDRDKLLDLVAKNAENYAQWRLSKLPGKKAILKKNRLEAFDTNAFQTALNDVTSAIASGKVSRGAGNIYTNTDGAIWDDQYHRAALDLVDRGILAMSPTSSTQSSTQSSTKQKLGSDRIKTRFNNRFYGGNFTGSEADWDRWKDNANAAAELADMIDDEIADIDANDYDYEGSAYKDKTDYRNRLSRLSANLRNGTLDNSDIADWSAIGGDSTFFRNVTGLKKPEAPRENLYEAVWATKEQDLRDRGFSEEDIAKLRELYWKGLTTIEGVNDDKTLYQKAYEDFVNTKWVDADDATMNWNDKDQEYTDEQIWGGINSDGSRKNGIMDIPGVRDRVYGMINDIYKGVSPLKGRNWTYNNATYYAPGIVRSVMKKVTQTGSGVTKIGNTNSYYINETLDLDTGSILRYDAPTNKFVRVYVKGNPEAKGQLLKMLQDAYRKKNPINASSRYGSIIPSSRHGSKLEKMKTLRNIPKAFNGLELTAKVKKQQEQEFQNLLSQDAMARYGNDSEESKQKTLLGNQKAFATESRSAKNGVKGGLDNSDWLRLGSALTDLMSIGASYTGAGMPVAGLMQLGSTGMDFIADLSDDTVDGWSAVKNLGLNLGLGVATTFGAGAVAKAGKIGKIVARTFPVALSAMGAANILGDKDFKNAIDKLGNGNMNKLTTNEWKSLSMAIKVFAGGHLATKSAAGQLGIDFGKNSNVARIAGQWGNNAWKGGDKRAYLAAVNRGGFQRGATVPLEAPRVKIGGVEVDRATALAMAKAGNSASKKPNATSADILKAMLDAYRASAEGKNNIKVTPGVKPGEITVTDAADEAALKAILNGVTANKKIGNMPIDQDAEFNFGNSVTKKGSDIPAALTQVYETAANATTGDAAAKHTAGLKAINDILNLWKTPDTETGVPTFDFNGIKGNSGKWDLSRFFGKVKIEDNAPGLLARARHKIHPKRYGLFDPNTDEGRANLELLYGIRRSSTATPTIFGRKLSTDIEFNSGLGIFQNHLSPLQNKYLRDKYSAQSSTGTNTSTTPTPPPPPPSPGTGSTNPPPPPSPGTGSTNPPPTPSPGTGSTNPPTTPSPTIDDFIKNNPVLSKMDETRIKHLLLAAKSNPLFKTFSEKEILLTLNIMMKKYKIPSHEDVLGRALLGDSAYRQITDGKTLSGLKSLGIVPRWAKGVYKKIGADEYAYYRLGGRLEQLKALRMGFMVDDSYVSDELSKFANGGIVKAQDGTVADWYKKRYTHLQLIGYKPELRTDFAGSTISESGKHHMDSETGDLTSPFKTNQAYTANSDAIRSDIQSYYDSDEGFDDLEDFVNQYNRNAGEIRHTWDSGHNVNESGAKAHNQLFKKMFPKRAETGTDYGLGYDPNSEDTLGSTTWQRRMDQYEREWDDTSLTDDERKKRIHQIKLKNGTTGYVYKKANGDIGIADDDTLTRLGLKQSVTKGPVTENKADETGNGKSLGDGGGIATQPNAGRDSNFTNFLGEVKKGLPTTLATTRLINNLRNNKKVAEIAKLKKTVTLLPILKHRDVYGDFASLQLAKAYGANYHRTANNVANNTANSELAAIARFEGQDKYNKAEMQGRALDNTTIAKTREVANAVADQVYDYNHKVGDENMARFVAKYNANVDTDMGKQAANTTNWESYLMGLENEARTNQVDAKTRQLAYYADLVNNYTQDATVNTPEYQAMLNEYNNTTDTTRANQLLTLMSTYRTQKLKEIAPILRKLRQNNILGNYNINDIPEVYSNNFTFETNPTSDFKMVGLSKKGGKIDSSRMKYRSEDLKELRKQIRHNIDTNRKALDNLSKATLLELKKSMGL